VTDRVDESGRLDWDVPAGEWTLIRFVCGIQVWPLATTQPELGRPRHRSFNPEATKFHFEYLLDKLHQELATSEIPH